VAFRAGFDGFAGHGRGGIEFAERPSAPRRQVRQRRGANVRDERSESGRKVLFKRSKSLVGLDIGSNTVKAIELKPNGKNYRVSAIAVQPVPPDSIVDGSIIDSGAVTDSVGRLFATKQFKGKDVAASLSGNSVIVKKVTLPVMSESELAESIYWEAEQYIPFDIQDVNLDYQIISGSRGGNSQGTMEVLLVAAKKDKIADYMNVITQAGRSAVVVDVDAFALQNAYEANYGYSSNAVVALLNAGASAININILAGAQSVFTRDISMGGNAFTEAIQKELSLPFEAAEDLKKGDNVDGVTYADARPVLRAMTDNVLLEVEKTFDFFKATASSDHIDRIMLSGGASRVEGFMESLRERFDTQVELFDPFRQVFFDVNKLAVSPEEMAPLAAVAVGLALRRGGDR
jgi:type IV pilus assembly protein PilM